MQPCTFTIRAGETPDQVVLTQTAHGYRTEVARGTVGEVRAWREIAIMAYLAGTDTDMSVFRARNPGGLDIVTVIPVGKRGGRRHVGL